MPTVNIVHDFETFWEDNPYAIRRCPANCQRFREQLDWTIVYISRYKVWRERSNNYLFVELLFVKFHRRGFFYRRTIMGESSIVELLVGNLSAPKIKTNLWYIFNLTNSNISKTNENLSNLVDNKSLTIQNLPVQVRYRVYSNNIVLRSFVWLYNFVLISGDKYIAANKAPPATETRIN